MADEAPNEMKCPHCHGTRLKNGQACDLCGGSGKREVTTYPPDTDPYKDETRHRRHEEDEGI